MGVALSERRIQCRSQVYMKKHEVRLQRSLEKKPQPVGVWGRFLKAYKHLERFLRRLITSIPSKRSSHRLRKLQSILEVLVGICRSRSNTFEGVPGHFSKCRLWRELCDFEGRACVCTCADCSCKEAKTIELIGPWVLEKAVDPKRERRFARGSWIATSPPVKTTWRWRQTAAVKGRKNRKGLRVLERRVGPRRNSWAA